MNGLGRYSGSPGYYINNGKAVFSYTGGVQSFVVPAGVTSLIVKLWGGGGGHSNNAGGYDDYGGAGGYVTGTLAVTPGETLTIVVGPGGTAGGVGGFGGGGSSGGSASGSGGGFSGIFRGGVSQAAALAIAGGGGGGANNADNAWSGGEGGGTTGGNGRSGGTGGTQSAGGSAGGGALTGASGTANGGGGGGGYFGGGGGTAADKSGGGGSGYSGGLTSASFLTSADHYSAPNVGDADYAAGIAVGGRYGVSNGGNGRVVLNYVVGMRLVVPAVVTLNTAPSFANLYFLWKDDSGAAVLGTDIAVNLSRNGGTNKSAATLTWLFSYDGTYSLLRARADLSGQPVGTSLWAEIITTTKIQRVAAPGLYAE